MTPSFLDRLYANFTLSWQRFGVIAGGLFALVSSWFLALPQTQCPPSVGSGCVTQAALLAYLPISGSTITIILGLVVYYLSIHPQGLPTTAQIVEQHKAASLADAAYIPPDDAFVAVGAQRFSDNQVQTAESLATAAAVWNGMHPNGPPASQPKGST